jgi:uncharacterized protein (TIGR02996 family)
MDREVFLQGIRDEPQHDGPRLLLAGWLEANGEEALGEFLRVQCELHALTPRFGNPLGTSSWLGGTCPAHREGGQPGAR